MLRKRIFWLNFLLCLVGAGLSSEGSAHNPYCNGFSVYVSASVFTDQTNITANNFPLSGGTVRCQIDNGTVGRENAYWSAHTPAEGLVLRSFTSTPYSLPSVTSSFIYNNTWPTMTVSNVSLKTPLDGQGNPLVVPTMASGTVLLTSTINLLGFFGAHPSVGGTRTTRQSYVTYILAGEVDNTSSCDITSGAGQAVTLPSVPRADLMSVIGRYTRASKDFTFALKCKNKPKISLTLDGTNKMSGATDDGVLKNTTSGNDNVGFQIYYNDSPMKFDDKTQLMTSSQENEQLKFTVWYYRKAGDVNAGNIRSNAEFKFDYD